MTEPPPAAAGSSSALTLTGERTLPGIPDEAYWFARHVVAYRLAAPRAADRVVLDAGCGEGYGVAMLADAGARRVIGADLDGDVVQHVVEAYGGSRPSVVEAVACELMDLPLADDEVDLTVSFQVIEHLYDVPGYLASLLRVTRPGGEVLLATPNRLTFTPGSETPVNPFHIREFTATELRDELERAGFMVPLVLGVHHAFRIRALETLSRRPFTRIMTTRPADTWPGWYRRAVHHTTAGDFEVRPDDLDRSLDLVAVCRVPRSP